MRWAHHELMLFVIIVLPRIWLLCCSYSDRQRKWSLLMIICNNVAYEWLCGFLLGFWMYEWINWLVIDFYLMISIELCVLFIFLWIIVGDICFGFRIWWFWWFYLFFISSKQSRSFDCNQSTFFAKPQLLSRKTISNCDCCNFWLC